MKYLYILVPFALASIFMSACGDSPSEEETKIRLNAEITDLSRTNLALMKDWPIQQAAADTLMAFYQNTHDRYTKNVLLKEAGVLLAEVEVKKNNILANAMKIHQDKLHLKQLVTPDKLVVLSDSVSIAAITASDTLIKQLASDSSITP